MVVLFRAWSLRMPRIDGNKLYSRGKQRWWLNIAATLDCEGPRVNKFWWLFEYLPLRTATSPILPYIANWMAATKLSMKHFATMFSIVDSKIDGASFSSASVSNSTESLDRSNNPSTVNRGQYFSNCSIVTGRPNMSHACSTRSPARDGSNLQGKLSTKVVFTVTLVWTQRFGPILTPGVTVPVSSNSDHISFLGMSGIDNCPFSGIPRRMFWNMTGRTPSSSSRQQVKGKKSSFISNLITLPSVVLTGLSSHRNKAVAICRSMSVRKAMRWTSSNFSQWPKRNVPNRVMINWPVVDGTFRIRELIKETKILARRVSISVNKGRSTSSAWTAHTTRFNLMDSKSSSTTGFVKSRLSGSRIKGLTNLIFSTRVPGEESSLSASHRRRAPITFNINRYSETPSSCETLQLTRGRWALSPDGVVEGPVMVIVTDRSNANFFNSLLFAPSSGIISVNSNSAPAGGKLWS